MLRRLYDKTLALAGKRHAVWALAAVAFAESSFFPIPPDLLLIPMVLARRAKAWLLAGVCTLFSVGGGLFGYAIGYYLFDAFGGPLLDLWGNEEKLSIFERYRDEWGAWIVVAGGFTPLPYKLITIASGAGKLDIGVFILASAGRAGPALLYRGGASLAVRPTGPRLHRAAPGLGGFGRLRHPDRRRVGDPLCRLERVRLHTETREQASSTRGPPLLRPAPRARRRPQERSGRESTTKLRAIPREGRKRSRTSARR